MDGLEGWRGKYLFIWEAVVKWEDEGERERNGVI